MKDENKTSNFGLVLSILYIIAFAGALWWFHYELTNPMSEPRYERQL